MTRYEKYKDSGIEWIGEIPDHWEVKRLKYSISINDDVLNETTDEGLEINYVEIGDVNFLTGINNSTVYKFKNAPSRARRIVEKGDVIVSTVRTYLKAIAQIKEINENLIVSTGFAVLRPKTINSSYLGYYVLTPFFIHKTIADSVGVSYPAINSSNIGLFESVIPSTIEQTSIATYLDRKTTEIDRIIANKQKLIALYEEEKQAVINHAVTKGLDPTVKLKDSGVEWLGEIPEHWEVKKLKWVIEDRLKYGANESAELEDRELPRYIRITDFGDNGKLRDETFKSLPYEIAKDYLLEEGDVLFARSGATVGKTFQFKAYKGNACFAGYLIKAKPNKSIESDFLYYFTKSGVYDSWKNSIFNQATIQNIGADKYAYLELTIPSIMEQQSIVAHIEKECARLDAIISKFTKQIELLQ